MKKCYMVEFELPEVVAQEFLEKASQQRLLVDSLIEQGVVKSYCLAENRSKLWMVVSAESEFATMSVIGRMPLGKFMIPSISALNFHDDCNPTKVGTAAIAVSLS